MIINYLNSFIKSFGIILCICYSFYKISNYKEELSLKRILLFIFNVFLAIIDCIFKHYFSPIISTIITYSLYIIILSIFSNTGLAYSSLITFLSITITYVAFFISAILILFVVTITNVISIDNSITVTLIVAFLL